MKIIYITEAWREKPHGGSFLLVMVLLYSCCISVEMYGCACYTVNIYKLIDEIRVIIYSRISATVNEPVIAANELEFKVNVYMELHA